MLVLRKKDNTEGRLQFMFTIILVFVLRKSVNYSVNSASQQNTKLCNDHQHNRTVLKGGAVNLHALYRLSNRAILEKKSVLTIALESTAVVLNTLTHYSTSSSFTATTEANLFQNCSTA